MTENVIFGGNYLVDLHVAICLLRYELSRKKNQLFFAGELKIDI